MSLEPTASMPSFEQGEILRDQRPRLGPLNLDDDRSPVVERRAMHLADRSRRQRRRLDGLEHVLPRHAEVLLHDPNDVGLGQRRDVVAQAAKARR